jgi:hypothetical protein
MHEAEEVKKTRDIFQLAIYKEVDRIVGLSIGLTLMSEGLVGGKL